MRESERVRVYRNTTSKGEKSKWSEGMREKRCAASDWKREAENKRTTAYQIRAKMNRC